MFRPYLPDICPGCGEGVPRAAARRCPLCLTPFMPVPHPASRSPYDRGRDDES